MRVALMTGVLAVMGVGGLVLSSATPATAASHAAFTTTDVSQSTGACLNGNSNGGTTDVVNCNLYTAPTDVWLDGGPTGAGLSDGTYFFAVLAPAGQADPNDGSADLLSTDGYANRTFTVTNGQVSYSGTHKFDTAEHKIQVSPYDPTPNAGGVYILAVCALPAGGTQPVDPSSCKYDAYKIRTTSTAAAAPTLTKTASGSDTDTWTWGISKSVTSAEIDTAGSTGTFDYTVTVTHGAGTVSAVEVSGVIDVTDPNFNADSTNSPVTLSAVTDKLSDGTTCTVDTSGTATVATPTGGTAKASGLTLDGFDNYFPYSCTLSALPSGELDNTATATWADQTLSNTQALTGGTATFTFAKVAFTANDVDACASVSDSVAGSLGTVCSTDPSPTLLPYVHLFAATAGTCVTQPNTATLVTSTTGTTATDSKSVKLCEGADLQVKVDSSPSYTRTYQWGITKSGTTSSVTTSPGSTDVGYTVTADETGFQDSNVESTGTITVTNPNDWEAVTLTGVTDGFNNGGSCSIDAGSTANETATIPAGGQVALDYTCTYGSTAAGTDTATATWDATPVHTPDGSVTGTAAVAFGAPTTRADASITPTDAFNSGTPVTLCTLDASQPCTLSATDSPPYTTVTYHYTRSLPASADECTSYPNTAATGLGATATWSVKVCGTASGPVSSGPGDATLQTTPSSATEIVGKADPTFGDTATLTGSGPTPSGTVAFTLYDSSCAQVLATSPAETLAGGTYAYTSPRGWTPLTAGTYYWIVTYGGDGSYNPITYSTSAAGWCTGGEKVTVTPGTASLQTTPDPTTGPLDKAGTYGDQATLTGAGTTPTGTVTFILYNASCTVVLGPSSPVDLTDGAATYSASWTPSAPGKYYWVVTYSGDGSYNAIAAPGSCKSGEQVVVFGTSSAGGTTTTTTPTTTTTTTTTTTGPGTAPTTSPVTTVPPGSGSQGGLASTGADVIATSGAAAVLIGLGWIILRLSRRRSS